MMNSGGGAVETWAAQPGSAHGIGVAAGRRPMPAAAHGDGIDRMSRWSAFALVTASIFLQRFGLVFGGDGIFAPFLIAYIVFFVLLIGDRLRIASIRLTLFLLLVLAVLSSALLWINHSSILSLFYLIGIYGLYIFQFDRREGLFAYTRDLFLNCMLLCGILGILQFFLQTFFPPAFAFPIDHLVPQALLMPGFLWEIPLSYGSPIMKANGVFFLEPSVFSQFIALAVIGEMVSHARLHRIAIYLTAMLASYSGTGIMLLLACVPWVLLQPRHQRLILLGGVVALLFIPAGYFFNLDFFVGRMSEFQTPQSSGYMRFIAPLELLQDFVLNDWLTLFFGNGPGTIMRYATRVSYGVHDPSWAKIIFEYGIFGAVSFGLFLGTCLFHRSADRWLGLGILVLLMFMGGYLVLSFLHVLFIGLLVWHGDATPVAQHGDDPAHWIA